MPKITPMPKSLIVVLFLLYAAQCNAQYRPTAQDTTLFRIETKDGNVYFGVLSGQEGDKILLQTKSLGIIRVATSDIRSMTSVSAGSDEEKTGNPNFHTANYFNLPNGYGMRKGEIYYKNSMLAINHLAIGITDRLSVGAGMIPLFLFGSDFSPYWVIPKYVVPVVPEKVNLAFSGILGGVTGIPASSTTILQGAATFGSRDRNVSGGLAYGFFDGRLYSIPVVTLEGMIRSADNHYFMGEAFVADGWVYGFLGGRWHFGNATIDYGVAILQTEFEATGIPWGSLMIPLRRPKK